MNTVDTLFVAISNLNITVKAGVPTVSDIKFDVFNDQSYSAVMKVRKIIASIKEDNMPIGTIEIFELLHNAILEKDCESKRKFVKHVFKIISDTLISAEVIESSDELLDRDTVKSVDDILAIVEAGTFKHKDATKVLVSQMSDTTSKICVLKSLII